MASFPDAVKAFIAKIANADKVKATHINDLQDEVEAIETLLLSGTAGQVLTVGEDGKPAWVVPSGGGLLEVRAVNIKTDDYTLEGCEVSGAGTEEVNGFYQHIDGYQYINITNESISILGDLEFGSWRIIAGDDVYYFDNNSFAVTPDLVSNWQIGNIGSLPVPTIVLKTIAANQPKWRGLCADGLGGMMWV